MDGRNPDWRDHAVKWLRWATYHLEGEIYKNHSEDACSECLQRFATWIIRYDEHYSTGGICRRCMKELRASLPNIESVAKIAYWRSADFHTDDELAALREEIGEDTPLYVPKRFE